MASNSTPAPQMRDLQAVIEDMKKKQAHLQKTIEDLTEDQKVKVALQVKQIEERNRLENQVTKLMAQLQEISEHNKQRIEKLTERHVVEMEELKSSSGGSAGSTPASSTAGSPAKSTLTVKLGNEDQNKRIKELQEKVGRSEREHKDLKARLGQLQNQIEENKKLYEDEKDDIRKELQQKSKQYEEKLKEEQRNYITQLTKKPEANVPELKSPLDEINIALTNQLAVANDRIVSLEVTVEELKLQEKDHKRQLHNTCSEHENKSKTTSQEIEDLQKKIQLLTANEQMLKSENEHMKHQYDPQVTAQNSVVEDMKHTIDALTSNEDEMRRQLESTQRDCEVKLDEATVTYSAEVGQLSDSIAAHQEELMRVIGELEEAHRDASNMTERFGVQLDRKAEELDEAYEKLHQLEAQIEKTASETEDKADSARKELRGKLDEIKNLKISLQEKTSQAEALSLRVTEMEQNLGVWKTAANEKAGTQSDLLRQVAETEAKAQKQREALQEKIDFLTKQTTVSDSTSSDALGRMEMLEQTIAEKEQAAIRADFKVKEVTAMLESQSAQFSQTVEDLDQVISRNQEKIQRLEQQLVEARQVANDDKDTAVREAEERLQKKRSELELAHSKIDNLREESKDRVKDLKKRVEELTERLAEKEQRVEDKETEMKTRIKALADEFEVERSMLILDQQATAKFLNERLDKEREAMNAFKDNVKKQFDERQDQVKEMLTSMKTRFAETLKDKEEIFNRRVQKAEKAKEREKMIALKERESKFQEQFAEYKSKNDADFKTAVEEVKSQFEAEIKELKRKVGGKDAKKEAKVLQETTNSEKTVES